MTSIVLASGNQGKLREFRRLASQLPGDVSVEPQSVFNVSDADETGLSFVENAIIKARHAAEVTGMPALADDSGLEVDFLNGAPGIYSARYCGDEGDPAKSKDQRNIDKLLDVLQGVEEADRSARYQCVLVFMRHASDPTPLICQASWEGRILESRSGDGGFGYDPIFYVPELACSAAELESEAKNRISHRGRAMAMIAERLPQWLA